MHLSGFAIAGLVVAFLVVLLAAGLRPAIRPSGTGPVVVVVDPDEPDDEPDDGVIADEVVADETLADETSPSRDDD